MTAMRKLALGTVPSTKDAPDALSRSVQRLQNEIDQLRRQLNTLAFIDGADVKDIVIGPVATKVVAHPLGRTPRGWLLTELTASGTLTAPAVRRTAQDANSITFANDDTVVTVTFNVRVF